MDTEKAAADQGQYLGLFIGDEEYAIGILHVKEILQFDALTRVPGTPPSVRGVINVRGSVVPVIDLAVKFGLPESVITKRSCIVIVEVEIDGEGTVMGVMADAVSQVVELGPADILPPPSFGTRVQVDYLRGMGRSGRKFILILDIDRVLTVDELQVAAAARAAAAEAPEDAPAPAEAPAPEAPPAPEVEAAPGP